MNTKKIFCFAIIILTLLTFFPRIVLAGSLECEDRYLTLVNPVRGRDRWQDRSLSPIKDQYEIIKDKDFGATWLIQYGVLNDKELVDELKGFNDKQEIGLFLEVSENFAYASEVIYPHAKPWTDPSALFLSGYSQSERRKLLDKMFSEFNDAFGYYPRSVGAWWIDSYSLNYIEEKYGIDAVLICADQKTTDNYGVWGQWWGIPYYPAKYNLLKPASNAKEQSDFVVIQWAQRDLTKAYGDDFTYSNYSLQANDYLERGLDTEYFKKLTSDYLDCSLPLGQVTVGLETGIEGATYKSEYKNQLDYLRELAGLKPVTMSSFYNFFKEKYTSNPERLLLNDGESNWILTTDYRENEFLNEKISYTNTKSFSDYFTADKESFLNRNLSDGEIGKDKQISTMVFLLPIIAFFIYALRKSLFKEWVLAMAFLIAAYGLLLRSGYHYGWKVFYGPVTDNLDYVNLLITTCVILLFFRVKKYLKKIKGIDLSLFCTILPLTFGLDTIIRLLRYTNIEGKHFLGVVLNTFDFYGFTLPDFKIVSLKLPHVVAGSLLKFDMDKIWSSFGLSVFIYPLLHIVLAGLITYLLAKLKPGVRLFIIILLTVLFIAHLYYIFTADPRVVIAI